MVINNGPAYPARSPTTSAPGSRPVRRVLKRISGIVATPVYVAYCVAEPALDQPSIIRLALPLVAVVLVVTERSCTSHSSG